MKAISPMVAVILLIAFTIAIGGILSVWFTGLVRITAGPAEAAAEKVAKCAPAWINVERVDNTTSVNMTIIASNPSTLEISAIKVTLDGKEKDFTLGTDPYTLTAGEADMYNINTTEVAGAGFYVYNFTSVVVRGLCLGEVPKEGRCSKGDVCWKIPS